MAEPNTTGAVRDAVILAGGASFYVRQDVPVQPGLAAAPSQLTFGVDKKGRTSKQTLAVWADQESATFLTKVSHPWLQVTPKRGNRGRQVYEVTVQRDASLAPGRYDTTIELYAQGAPARSITVPVVVEVFGRP